MGLNDTPQGERKHIAFFGCTNAGKSSLINAVTGQKLSIVSDIAGTTTDPVYKSMELLPAGPVVIIDTPGIDDESILGKMRIEKAKEVIRKSNLAVVVIDSSQGVRDKDMEILDMLQKSNIPCIVAYNKLDVSNLEADKSKLPPTVKTIAVSAVTNAGINELKELIAATLNLQQEDRILVGDLVNAGDIVILVVPIDKAAPKGRLILPQQQTIRELLDYGAIPIMCRDSELESVIEKFGKDIALVITDSQAFRKVGNIVPDSIPLTSFSILFSRYKGELEYQLEGIKALRNIKDGDKILIAEGCTHHRQCGDIGTEKIPAMLKGIADVQIDFCSGNEFPKDISIYKLIIHCGACMLNEAEMKSRIQDSKHSNVPMTNYGMTIAEVTGILERSMRILSVDKKGRL